MIDGNDVERWLSYAQENIRHFGPREGSAIPAEALAELCRTWLAVQDAPVGFVVGQSGPDGFYQQHSGAIVQMDDPASVKGKRVRIVPDPTP